jgi:hypothetical protein
MTNLSRRHLVTSAAALPVLAVPALPAIAGNDPVIAMVDNCRAAWARLGQVCKREPVDANGRPEKGAREDEWRQEQADAGEEHSDLEAAMFATAPHTKEGAAALVRYHLEINHDFLSSAAEDGWAEEELFTSLLSYLDAVQS